MDLSHALRFTHTSVAQEIVCDTDAITRLCRTGHAGSPDCDDRLRPLAPAIPAVDFQPADFCFAVPMRQYAPLLASGQ